MADSAGDLSVARRAYAERVTQAVDGIDPRIIEAFAAVPRERFLGPPPWWVIREPPGPKPTETSDAAAVYDNVLVVLDGSRSVNNGSPSLHALMLHALGVLPGDRVVHVGAGSGYYSALIGALVGTTGRVTAVEYDAALAMAAQANLAPWPTVRLVQGDGGAFPTETVDRVYVNFGSVVPPRRWVDCLAEGGTLVFPLTAPTLGRSPKAGGGVVLRVARSGGVLDASIVSPCGFVMAEGPLAGDADQGATLAAALGARSLGLGPMPAGALWTETERWTRWFG